jgi:hypothetical protein
MLETTTQDTLQKLTGNVSDELGEAGYRLAADQLVDLLQKRLVDSAQIRDRIAPGMSKEFQANMNAFLRSEAGEAVISFVLAAALELLPIDVVGQDVRRTLASNLRIQAYQELGEVLLQVAGFLNEDIEEATRRISGRANASAQGERTDDAFSRKG